MDETAVRWQLQFLAANGQIAAAQLKLGNVENEHLFDAACFSHSLEFFKEGDFERDSAITLWRWAQHEMSQGNKSHTLRF